MGDDGRKGASPMCDVVWSRAAAAADTAGEAGEEEEPCALVWSTMP